MNSIFHINVFSQIPLAPSSPIEWWENMVVAPIEEWKSSTNRIRTTVATGLLALSLSTGAQERPTALASNETQPILLAQANVEDGRTGPYSAIVPQVKGWSKMVEYYKNKRGLIIPPPIENGKLADGSDAPADPLEAKAEQRSVIAKYAKVVLVKIDRKDLAIKANEDLGRLRKLMEQSRLDKNGLYDGFSAIYIVKHWLGTDKNQKDIDWINTIINTLEKYGQVTLKMNQSEIETIKRKAEQDAQNKLNTLSSSAA